MSVDHDKQDIDLESLPATSATTEQHQRLLKNWGIDGDEDENESNGEDEKLAFFKAKRLQKRYSILFWILTGISAILLIIAAGEFVLNLRAVATHEVQDALSVQTNDYILSPQWDYNAPPQTRHYTWTVRDQVHNPDGIYRPMMLVNNQFPGPLIEVNEGDTIVVQVENRAVNATSIHWHGIYQNGTPHMDGTVGITQCPIPPGATFTYEFTVNNQSGTYWWHAHQGVQSSDGMHGPLVIHGRQERKLQQIAYDTDRVLLVSDHYHDLSSDLLWKYLAPGAENAEPVPLGGVINGRSIRNCDAFPTRKCSNTSSHVGLPRLDLAPNQSHRLRLVNVGAFAEFQVQIDEHELAVTEVDGTDVHPQAVHRVNINPAQRYSVVVNTSSTNSDTFWFRARMITKCFTDAPRNLDPDALAIVRYYTGAERPDETPTSIDWGEALKLECKDMNTSVLAPVESITPPLIPDAFFHIRSNFEIGAWKLSRGFFNRSSWRSDVRSPTLLRAIDGLASANLSFQAPLTSSSSADNPPLAFLNTLAFDSSRELIIQTTTTQTIDLLISNFDDGNHPIHLHGYKFFVLAQGHGYAPLTSIDAEVTYPHLAPLYDTLDLSNPLRRDTASVEAFGWTLIRVITDNPGSWALHCHVSWHAEAGLLMQLLTRTDDLKDIQVPEENRGLCLMEGLEKGMGPRDEDYKWIPG